MISHFPTLDTRTASILRYPSGDYAMDGANAPEERGRRTVIMLQDRNRLRERHLGMLPNSVSAL